MDAEVLHQQETQYLVIAGSFSLGMAAMLTGRYAVGIELSKVHDAGFDRLKNTLGFNLRMR